LSMVKRKLATPREQRPAAHHRRNLEGGARRAQAHAAEGWAKRKFAWPCFWHSLLASSRISAISASSAASFSEIMCSRTSTGVAAAASIGGGPAGAAATPPSGSPVRPRSPVEPDSLAGAAGGGGAAEVPRMSLPSGEMEVLPRMPCGEAGGG
jgi:hypothetical protein